MFDVAVFNQLETNCSTGDPSECSQNRIVLLIMTHKSGLKSVLSRSTSIA